MRATPNDYRYYNEHPESNNDYLQESVTGFVGCDGGCHCTRYDWG